MKLFATKLMSSPAWHFQLTILIKYFHSPSPLHLQTRNNYSNFSQDISLWSKLIQNSVKVFHLFQENSLFIFPFFLLNFKFERLFFWPNEWRHHFHDTSLNSACGWDGNKCIKWAWSWMNLIYKWILLPGQLLPEKNLLLLFKYFMVFSDCGGFSGLFALFNLLNMKSTEMRLIQKTLINSNIIFNDESRDLFKAH